MRRTKQIVKIKVGVSCPACSDEIFSFYRNDFRRCKCGKVFIDGGEEMPRFGAESPVHIEDVFQVVRQYDIAKEQMSEKVRSRLRMPPAPISYFAKRKKYQFIWHGDWNWPRNIGPFPPRGPMIGGIFKWRFVIGPLEVRRWSEK